MYNPYLIDPNPPDENKSMLPYPSFSDPRHPGTTYSFNGIRVPVDFFMLQLDIATHSEFGIVESLRKSTLNDSNYTTRRVRNREFPGTTNIPLAPSLSWLISWVPLPQNPSRVPFPGADAIKQRLNTGDCNAYIASLIAKANELYGKQGNVAVANDGLDLLNKISSQGSFVLKDFLRVEGYGARGTVDGSIAGNNTYAAGTATVLISTKFVFGNNPYYVHYNQQDYIDTAIHEMLHLAARYAGYDDRELAVAASQLPGANGGLPAAPKGPKDALGYQSNSGYYDRELQKHCGGGKR
jgi:hypothetical protein